MVRSKRKSSAPKAARRRNDGAQAPPPPLGRPDLRNAALIFGLALAIRSLHFFLDRGNNPLFYHPIMDALYHHQWAERIVGGDFWGKEVFFRAPLYPYVLALLYKISDSSIGFAVFFQHVLGAGSAVLTYLLSREFFPRPVSLVAGLTAALYWPFVYFEGDLLIVTLIIFLDLLALVCLARGLHSRRPRHFVAAGVVLGLSAVARPNILIFLAVVPVVFRRYRAAGGRPGPAAAPPWVRSTLLVYLASAAVIAPVIVRNYLVGRDIVPIASQGGVNLYIGNNPQSDGRTAVVPGTRWDWWGGYQDAIQIAERDRGRRLKPSEVSNYYAAKALRFAADEPGRWIALTLHKFRLFWAGGERSNNKYIYFFWRRSGMGRVPLPGFWLVVPFALLGAVVLWPRRNEFLLLYLFVISYMLGVVAFFVNARFRLPVVPVLIVFCAYAVFRVADSLRRPGGGTIRMFALLVLCFLAIDIDFVRFRENKVYADSISHYTLGNAYLKTGDADRAINEYEAARRIDRRYPTSGYRLISRNVEFNLGKLYWSRQRYEQAIPHLERVGGNDRFTAAANEYLAECYAKEGRFGEAARMYDAILGSDPDRETARRGLAHVLLELARADEERGDRDAAVARLQRARALLPGDRSIADALRQLEDEN